MTELTLLDAAIVIFVILRIVRARSLRLGDSLHGLIALLLLIGLFLGFRMTGEVREILSGVANSMRAVPGLGSKLLILVAAWYIMRLIRRKSGHLIERAVPASWHRRITPFSEGLRALLLSGFIVWLAEGWFDEARYNTPKIVQVVRYGDAWVLRMQQSESANPYRGHRPYPLPRH